MRVTADRQGSLRPQPGETRVARDSCPCRDRVLADPRPWDLAGASELGWHLAKRHGVAVLEYLDPTVLSEIDRKLGRGWRETRASANGRAAARRRAGTRWRRDRESQVIAERFAAAEFDAYMTTALPEELAEQT